MLINVAFYAGWVQWWERRGLQLARQNPIGFAVFLSDSKAVVNLLIGDFVQVAALFHGNPISIAVRLWKYARANADPLVNVRQAMLAMRAKYGEVDAPSPSAPASGPSTGTPSGSGSGTK